MKYPTQFLIGFWANIILSNMKLEANKASAAIFFMVNALVFLGLYCYSSVHDSTQF